MITSLPDAPLGTVAHLDSYRASDFKAPAAVLCRNTAPLVSFCYNLLSRDIPCHILGKDIGAQLASLVDSMRATTVSDLRERLDNWHAKATAQAEAEGRSPEKYTDQYCALCFLCTGLETPDQVVSRINRIFDDSPSGIIFSTIHKSKGMEWPTVFLLDFHLIPSRYAKTEPQLRQENNLAYVAITRSMENLFYITSENWKD